MESGTRQLMGLKDASGGMRLKAEPAAGVERLREEVKRKRKDRWHDSLADATTWLVVLLCTPQQDEVEMLRTKFLYRP